ncbi:tetratricopeptide repeat protein [uncultured Ruegeria sp.]|uniref:tetratricopeptide repeat protein n=1 Tax=uncultured Ruegeria sp. TaxID=259304 RepID=UPI002636D85A|nr:tetratricopeptide repeat protein [uncultured Ruegeria sp.]
MSAIDDLSWPEAYKELLPLITDRWSVKGEIYFHRRLSAGKSGALVYIVDITCDAFSGQAILKLDALPDPEWEEKTENQRHLEAFEAIPAFGSKHLARIVNSLEHEGKIAILSTVVAQGLEYSLPWNDCGYELALNVLQRLSRSLLDDWNSDYQMATGMHSPRELLSEWLGYRLDPEAGRLHRFLSDVCGHDPKERCLMFEGHWYPNPMAFAYDENLPSRLSIRAAKGRLHGDLHGYNVLVRSHQSSDPDYYLIDLALYQDKQFLFYDHAYFELAYLLARRGNCVPAQWDAILDDLGLFHSKHHTLGLWQDDVGIVEFVRTLRRGAMSWVERHESHRLSFMESQYLLARVAVGLNFAHKHLSVGARSHAFLYAAHNLKDYMTLNNVDWPRHGPVFQFPAAHEPISGSQTEPETLAPKTEPPAEKDRLFDRMVTQLPAPQKPVIAVLPFDNLSGQSESNGFVAGINQELVTELAKVDWLSVVSPTSTKLLKDASLSGEEIAQRLGAHYLVEGSVRYDDQRVRVTAHLVDTSTGHDLWADRLDHKIEDVFSLQEEIAAAVVGHIDWELRFDLREQARLKRGEVNVWDKVQKALWHLFKFTDEDTQKANDILTKTIDMTPDYALAHAVMANAELRKLFFVQVDDRKGAKERALYHAERAVALDEHSSFAHATLARAYTLYNRYDAAIAEAELAVGLNPSAANAHLVLGYTQLANGQAKQALEHIETATRFGPSGPYFKVKLLSKAMCLYLLDNLEQAEDCARTTLEGRSVGPFGHYVLAVILIRQHRVEEARQIVRQSKEIRPDMTCSRVRLAFENLQNDDLNKFVRDLREAGLPE